MRPFVAVIFLALAVVPTELRAESWISLQGDALFDALADKTLVYETATQKFYRSGNTLYNAGQDSWGKWRVDGAQYCSQWPPTDQWDCYFFEVNDTGDGVRFIAKDGSATSGRYMK